MNAKKILSVLLALTLCLGAALLVACKSKNPNDPDDPSTPAEKKNFAITVVDDKSNPVEGAKVNFYAGTTLKGSATTNAGGVVMIELEAVAYNIVVDAPTGYSAAASYSLPAGTTVMTITLTKEDTRPTYTVIVKDMVGDPIPGLAIQLCVTDGGCILGPNTDANGTSLVQVPAVGNYYLTFPNKADFAELYLFEEKYYFDEGSQTINVTLYPNNIPDGTVEKPFIFAGEPYTVTLPANSTVHFAGFGLYGRDFIATGLVGGKLVCGDLVATAEADGTLAVTIPALDSNEVSNVRIPFSLENTGATELTVTFDIKSKPGTAENPIVITDLSAPLTVEVKQGAAVYYVYNATTAGTLTVTCTDNRNNITLNNLTTSCYGDYTEGAASTSATFAAADTVQLVVCTRSTESQSNVSLTLTFALTVGAPSDPATPDQSWS